MSSEQMHAECTHTGDKLQSWQSLALLVSDGIQLHVKLLSAAQETLTVKACPH